MVRELPEGIKNPLVRPPRGRYNRGMEKLVRAPIVAGAFYPGAPEALRRTMASLFKGGVPASTGLLAAPLGLIAPHAGYPYSGEVAAAGYARAAACGRPEIAVLLGANHTGLGGPACLSSHAAWATPLGRSPVARDVVGRIAALGIPICDAAFAREHSLEVQLPFVQSIWGGDLPIVPVCVMSHAEAHVDAIADGIGERRALLVASSDFTHYEPDRVARELDRSALDAILAVDSGAFARQCREQELSICGAGAIQTLLDLCRRLHLTRAELVRYATSGDITGERSAVVGYAAVTFTSEAL